MRTISSLNDDWSFTRTDPEGDNPVDWEMVNLPHAWNTSPDGVPTGVDDRGPGWYRRTIRAPGNPGERRVFLEIGAAGTVADVWCNDTHLTHHRGGYSAFRCDLTDALDAVGMGNVTIRADNSATEDVYPLMGDHTIFGGCYRGARLVVVGPVHLDLGDFGGPGVVARQLELDDSVAQVAVTVRVTNDGATSTTPEVDVAITDADGHEVATATTHIGVPAGTVVSESIDVTIPNPRRWDARHDPHCYTVTARVDDDEVSIPLGLRTIEVDPEAGFILNGRPYPLRGVSRHHDIDGTPAVSDAEIVADMDLIDEIGATAVRLAHYQHPQAVLDECDRRGIVVWAEIPLNSQASVTDPSTNAISQLTELIHQQRHHPSIVCWGIQNETVIGEHAADPRPLIAELAEFAHAEDPDRPTAQAQLLLVTPDDPINRLADANAMNLYQGWYLGDAEEVGPVLDAHREANPDVPLGLSEYGADARVEYHRESPTAGDYTEDYQAILHERYIAAIGERPWLWATFVWNMFDFASVIRNEGGTPGFNMKGLVTRDRRTRKDAFHLYRAHWSAEPMVHICAKRFVHRAADQIMVKVYSNQSDVQLSANGTEQGIPHVSGRVFTWHVPLGDRATTVVATAGAVRDEATFERVAEADPSYECPNPRRVIGGERMDSWFEDAGIEVDRSGYGTFSLLGDLLDDPATRQVLINTFGQKMLAHPQLEMARGFTLDFVIDAVAGEMTLDDRRTLHESLAAVPRRPLP